MSKQRIIDYVMNTPGNTNPNILRNLLDDESSNNKFIVTLTLTSETGGIADKSNKEIYEAIQAGKEIWFTGNMSDMIGYFPLAYYTVIEGFQYPFIGTRFDMVSSNDQVYLVYMTASDTEIYDFSMESHSYEKEDSKFIVTLTPTALDYSGTMDKTVAEIHNAYQAGKRIVFRLITNENQYYEMDSCERGNNDTSEFVYPSYNAIGIVGTVFGKFYTTNTNDGTKNTYTTNIYTLTPAS